MYLEQSMWVFLANGDAIYCSDEDEVEIAHSSLRLLYQLLGLSFKPRVKESAPCYLVFDGKEHSFTKKLPVEADIFTFNSFSIQ